MTLFQKQSNKNMYKMILKTKKKKKEQTCGCVLNEGNIKTCYKYKPNNSKQDSKE